MSAPRLDQPCHLCSYDTGIRSGTVVAVGPRAFAVEWAGINGAAPRVTGYEIRDWGRHVRPGPAPVWRAGMSEFDVIGEALQADRAANGREEG